MSMGVRVLDGKQIANAKKLQTTVPLEAEGHHQKMFQTQPQANPNNIKSIKVE